jgi:hypothetical protein
MSMKKLSISVAEFFCVRVGKLTTPVKLYRSDLKDSAQPQELQKEIYATVMLLQVHYLCNFCRQGYVYKITMLLDLAHAKHNLLKMFKHLMISVKIVLCLESQETITELLVHTHTHRHTRARTRTYYANKFTYVFGGYWVNSDVLTEDIYHVSLIDTNLIRIDFT